ncbi:hypothetical protein AXX17_AT4G03540 [Arabidopsis thaliana]|uniref:Uncharacterized protein n=1 Tax=Arabidopsis thaliana TaxID=3702 RepID=A0A178UW20_ARATH|nr:hypothetical protein AXX17_AT4G03540 [Arabidopsis thaliana]
MGDIIGHKDRQIWSPSHHVLQDPLFDHSNKHQKYVKNHHHHGIGEFRRPGAPPLRQTFPLNYNTRQKHQSNWQRSKGEDRMQAFFLVTPGRTTSGTGVFLPATASHPPTKKTGQLQARFLGGAGCASAPGPTSLFSFFFIF